MNSPEPENEPQVMAEYYAKLADTNAGHLIRADAQLSLARRELNQRTQGFRILSLLSDAIALRSHADMGPVFVETLARIHEVMHVDRSVVFLEMASQQGIFEVACYLGLGPTVQSRLAALRFSFDSSMMNGMDHLMVSRKSAKSPLGELLKAMLELAFFICVPLKSGEKVFGYLLSSNDKEAYPFYPPFDHGHYEIFTAIASFLSNAWMNGHLYADLAQARDHLNASNSALEARVLDRTQDLNNRNQQLATEKARTEELLLNMLPKETALELQRTGQAVPRSFDAVSVVFSDIVGFTDISEKMSAGELVSELDQIFRAFDHIVQRHGLEKLKTIGDCFMFAGGLPTPNPASAVAAVKACLEFQDFIVRRKVEMDRQGKPCFLVRYGIHSGPVVAGVVGSRKFVYDIWGSTVNIAARLESASEIGRVNISAATYELVKDHFDCHFRGEITVKHGLRIAMYYIVAPKETAASPS